MSFFERAREPRDSGAAIRIGEKSHAESEDTRWGLLLVIFMRLLAGLCVVQGLLQWGTVLLPQEPLFGAMPASSAIAVIFFAVLDLVAAVGLWLATPWGGVLWLFAAIAQIFVTVVLTNFYSLGWIGIDLVLILAYFFLTWQAGHAGERTWPRRRAAP